MKTDKRLNTNKDLNNFFLQNILLSMKITAELVGLMPEGMGEYEFDIVSGCNKVVGLHYWTGKECESREEMKHHFKKIENNILLDMLAAEIGNYVE